MQCSVLLCVFLYFYFFPLTSRAQFFVAHGQNCPVADEVKTDTLDFRVDKSMPFDKCFPFRIPLPLASKLYSFTLIPIDKYAQKKVRRRDYHVFLKSDT